MHEPLAPAPPATDDWPNPPTPAAIGGARGKRPLRPSWFVAGAASVIAMVVGVVLIVNSGSGACAAVLRLASLAPPVSLSWKTGEITYYGPASAGGACSFTSLPANRYTAALGPAEYAAGRACGSYIEVKGRKGTIRVKVTNLCPECGPGHLDLTNEAFAALDDLGKGIAPISYRALRSPGGVGPLSVRVKEGSSRWWLGLLIDGAGNPLASVDVSSSGGAWQSLRLTDYNYWQADAGAGPGPFRVRITDVYGNQATVSGIKILPGQTQRTRAYLYGSGSTAPAPSATPSTHPTPSTSASTHKPKASSTPAATLSATKPPSTANATTAAPTVQRSAPEATTPPAAASSADSLVDSSAALAAAGCG